jgi:2-hydroxy-3-keto-5-methylthiopentenyl-1-phosphate phosphatase
VDDVTARDRSTPALPALPDPPTSSPMPAAPVPPLADGAPPIALLVDYDGTIAQTDVSDALMAGFVNEDWEAWVAEYDAGRVGSRRLMAWEVGLIDADPDTLRSKAATQPHDPAFRAFAERARAAGIPVEVVSDGFGFFIEPALAALGVGWIPVVTAATTFGADGARIDFPNGNAACFVCGTCKRDRVLAHQAAGRRVVFVGDGESDRYAAGYSDVVFAKHSLERFCLEQRWPFERWTSFSEIDRWLEAELGRFASDPRAYPRPVRRPLFCGAEVWGPGRFDPPIPIPPAGGVPPDAR